MTVLELNDKFTELERSLELLEKNGIELANSEYEYKLELTKQIYKLRSCDTPSTQMPLIIYGIPEVAVLRKRRDLAESAYKATSEKINVLKLQIRVMQNVLEKEYYNE